MFVGADHERERPGGGVGVGVDRGVRTDVPGGDDGVRLGTERDRAGRRGQIGELVVAVRVRRRGEFTAIAAGSAPRERDGDAGNGRLTGVLDTVAVHVVPTAARQRCRVQVEAGVEVDVVVARGHGDRPDGAHGIDVRVQGRVAPRCLVGCRPAGREIGRVDVDAVVARRDVRQPCAIGVGRHGHRDRVAFDVGAVDRHVDAAEAGFAGVLDAVTVEVVPHPVAEQDGLVHDELGLVGDGERGLIGVDLGVVDEGRQPGQAGGDIGLDRDRAGLADIEPRDRPRDVLASGRDGSDVLDAPGAGRGRGGRGVGDADREVVGDHHVGQVGRSRVRDGDRPRSASTGGDEGEHLAVRSLRDLDTRCGERGRRRVTRPESGRTEGSGAPVGSVRDDPRRVLNGGSALVGRHRVVAHDDRGAGRHVAEVPAEQLETDHVSGRRFDRRSVDGGRTCDVAPRRGQQIVQGHGAGSQLTGVRDGDAPRGGATDRGRLLVVGRIGGGTRGRAGRVRHLGDLHIGRQEPDGVGGRRAVVLPVLRAGLGPPPVRADIDGVDDRRGRLGVGTDGRRVGQVPHLPGVDVGELPAEAGVVHRPSLGRVRRVAGERHVGQRCVRDVLDRYVERWHVARVRDGHGVVDDVAGGQWSGTVRGLRDLDRGFVDQGAGRRCGRHVLGRRDRCTGGRRDEIVLVGVAGGRVSELVALDHAGAVGVAVSHAGVDADTNRPRDVDAGDLAEEHSDGRGVGGRVDHRAEAGAGRERRGRTGGLVEHLDGGDLDVGQTVRQDVGVRQIVVGRAGRDGCLDVVVDHIVRRRPARAPLGGGRRRRRVDHGVGTGVGERRSVAEGTEPVVVRSGRVVDPVGEHGGRLVGVAVAVGFLVGDREADRDPDPRGALGPVGPVRRGGHRAGPVRDPGFGASVVRRALVVGPGDDRRVAGTGRAVHDGLGGSDRIPELVGDGRRTRLVQRCARSYRPVVDGVGHGDSVDAELLHVLGVEREHGVAVGAHVARLRGLDEAWWVEASDDGVRGRRPRCVGGRGDRDRGLVLDRRSDGVPSRCRQRLAAGPHRVRGGVERDPIRRIEAGIGVVGRPRPAHGVIPQGVCLIGRGTGEHPLEAVTVAVDVVPLTRGLGGRRGRRVEQRRRRRDELTVGTPPGVFQPGTARDVAPTERKSIVDVHRPQEFRMGQHHVEVVLEGLLPVERLAGVGVVAELVAADREALPRGAGRRIEARCRVDTTLHVHLFGEVDPWRREFHPGGGELLLDVPGRPPVRVLDDVDGTEVVGVVRGDLRGVREAGAQVIGGADLHIGRVVGQRRPRLERCGVGGTFGEFGQCPRDFRAVGGRRVDGRRRRGGVRPHIPAHRIAVVRGHGGTVVELDVVRRSGTVVDDGERARHVGHTERALVEREW